MNVGLYQQNDRPPLNFITMKKHIIFSALIAGLVFQSFSSMAMTPRHDHKTYEKHQKHHKHHKIHKPHGIIDATYR